jgi:hypothetical protein
LRGFYGIITVLQVRTSNEFYQPNLSQYLIRATLRKKRSKCALKNKAGSILERLSKKFTFSTENNSLKNRIAKKRELIENLKLKNRMLSTLIKQKNFGKPIFLKTHSLHFSRRLTKTAPQNYDKKKAAFRELKAAF